MARLVCPTRTIDALVRQSISLIPERGCVVVRFPRTSFQRRSARHLTTGSPLCFRQSPALHIDGLAAVSSSPLDDAFIPFVHGPLTGHTPPLDNTALTGWPHSRRVPASDIGLFEPELEIHGTAFENIPTQEGADVLAETTSEFTGHGMEQNVRADWQADAAIDSVHLPSLHRPNASVNTLNDTFGELNLDIVLPERSRVDRRKDRKLRREKAKQEAKTAAELAAPTQVASQARKPVTDTPDAEEVSVRSILDEVRVAETARKDRQEAAKKRKLEAAQREMKIKMQQRKAAKEPWQVQKAAIKDKLGDQTWNPRKRISPDAIAGVRSLHASDPNVYSTQRLAEYFQISPDAVRRILKSKWQPREEEAVKRRERWERRGEKKWTELAAQGVRPPKKWRERGVGKSAEGEKPTWRKGEGSVGAGGGERWIEHRSPEELFARAAEAHAAQAPHRPRGPATRMSDRFL
ncbi:hypothetical protein K461DRAFT_123923 [Myriangium duriaei CBS 260.36]|uniref:Required for respiratory growth protein 9, mitochondrial n=1 Tax=Myriangium duriaei CBS 260.36 TaxID=1168546 RepID=A0A9P4MID9_9PEZI|nr:hypothetical protein K461DRAFT_123923 [Myriangium duriaei CBS 260.36]